MRVFIWVTFKGGKATPITYRPKGSDAVSVVAFHEYEKALAAHSIVRRLVEQAIPDTEIYISTVRQKGRDVDGSTIRLVGSLSNLKNDCVAAETKLAALYRATGKG